MREKKIELIKEASEEVKKVAWMLGVNDTDLLALLTKIYAEGLDDGGVLRELKTIKLKMTMRILARHRWVNGAVITESISEDGRTRRFTATIRGWQNWRIYEGKNADIEKIVSEVKRIRDRIDAGDETIFETPYPGLRD